MRQPQGRAGSGSLGGRAPRAGGALAATRATQREGAGLLPRGSLLHTARRGRRHADSRLASCSRVACQAHRQELETQPMYYNPGGPPCQRCAIEGPGFHRESSPKAWKPPASSLAPSSPSATAPRAACLGPEGVRTVRGARILPSASLPFIRGVDTRPALRKENRWRASKAIALLDGGSQRRNRPGGLRRMPAFLKAHADLPRVTSRPAGIGEACI